MTCGIVINDSILKLDAINELRKQGVPLLEAIHEAGKRRLRPIIMTSLTTIFGYGATVVLVRYGFGTAKAPLHSDDWYDGRRNCGESVYHPAIVLVYL